MFNIDPDRILLGYLVRHGELKNMNLWDGWGDFDLSPEGHGQAEAAARWLSFERIGRVISSDLPRTMETAQYLMNTGAVECPFLATDPNLRPWNVSEVFTGKEKTDENIAAFKKYIDDPALVIPGGESRNQLRERIQVAFTYLATPYKGLPTVIFTHNSVLRSLMDADDIKDAVSPGGIIAVYLTADQQIIFDIVLGEMNTQKGVS